MASRSPRRQHPYQLANQVDNRMRSTLASPDTRHVIVNLPRRVWMQGLLAKAVQFVPCGAGCEVSDRNMKDIRLTFYMSDVAPPKSETRIFSHRDCEICGALCDRVNGYFCSKIAKFLSLPSPGDDSFHEQQRKLAQRASARDIQGEDIYGCCCLLLISCGPQPSRCSFLI